MNSRLHGKKVLFLAPSFFDYPAAISEEMQSQGAVVIFKDERPSNDFFTKVTIRLGFKFFVRKKIENHFSSILSSADSDGLDYLFLIAPETVGVNFINKIRRKNNGVQVVLYMWDSLVNKKNALEVLPLADSVYSFDKSDSLRLEKVKFLPLFYKKEFEEIKRNSSKIKDIDISFVGTIHSDRYAVAKKVEQQAKSLGLKTFFYFYSPSKILFWIYKIFKKEFRCIDKGDVSFIPLSASNLLEVVSRSKVVLDIHHPKQIGLTMRSIEILGAGCKLLTTNSAVADYDFYCGNNIFILDREKPMLSKEKIISEYQDVSESIYSSYSIKRWVSVIF